MVSAVLSSACGAGGDTPVDVPASPERPTQLSVTRFVALGDSLTAGGCGQVFHVINEGVGGEGIEADAADLTRVLQADQPDVLLLLEGIHAINARHAAAIPEVLARLRGMIQAARQRGITVFVGTLLPEREGACRADDFGDGVNDIVAANIQLRTMVGEEGAILVDLYRAFSGRTAVLLGPDGLHPNVAGCQVMAEVFLAAIERQLGE
jgi:lysophospholipase L1-like esterase